MIGKTIAHYRVTAKLGAGGMGEVYRATDTKLGRDVALKVLPEAFAQDAQRMQRFQREAQVLASLNHPNIATIHGLEEAGGTRALVMELVEGPTLADRIAQGAIPLDEVLPIAKQVAEALEYAHEHGIIHRDLKPANIKLTADGQVKILDFGLAKALADDVAAQDISNSPTLTVAATKAGIILGTAAYMSPEQARGKSVDRRADVWSFGVVLFEMLTGVRAFAGEDVSVTLANVIKEDPDWKKLQAATPRRIRELLQRCLAKDPRQRLQAIGEARIALDAQSHATPEREVLQQTLVSTGVSWKAVAALAVLPALVVGGLVWNLRSGGTLRSTSKAQINLPFPLAFDYRPSLALSPDGQRLVFAGIGSDKSQLYLRRLDEFSATPIPGTEGARVPFFSPDGKSLGFTAGGKLKTISLSGGAPLELADADCQGAAWGTDGTIVFNLNHGLGLWKVQATGGAPEELTRIAKGEAGHHWPAMLPDGKHILFTIEADGKPYDEALIVVQSLETGTRQVLVRGGTYGRYVPTGHLVYWTGGNLLAVPFDVASLKVTGSPTIVVRDVMMGTANGYAQFEFSSDGTLIYLAGQDPRDDRALLRVDRAGRTVPLPVPSRAYESLRLSPDGQRLAVTIAAANDDIWLYEFGRRTLARLTFESENSQPVWSPDGKRLAFTAHSGGMHRNLYLTAMDGNPPEQLTASPNIQEPSSWSPDGKSLAFTEFSPDSGSDIWILPLEGDRKPRPLLKTRFDEGMARFSPDGRWIVYSSDESGAKQVYVRPFPGPGNSRQISIDGGSEPVWSANGREIFFRHGNKFLAADVQVHPEFRSSAPRVLFESEFQRGDSWSSFDVFPDGTGFIFSRQNTDPSTKKTLNVVFHWFEELRRLTAEGQAKQ